MLDLQFLTVDRLAIHTIHPRGPGRVHVPPGLGSALVQFPDEAKDMFNRRIAQALGHSSHGIQMDFRETGVGSFFQRAAIAMRHDDEDFLMESQWFATQLSSAQLIRDFTASKLIVIAGRSGNLQRRYLAVVKAEMQDGLGETQHNQQTVIQHLTRIFFTETQRLYKIGFVQENVASPVVTENLYDPTQFVVHLFDHLMTGTETRGAALYFYNTFMGADIAASNKRMTRDFFEKTKSFFDSTNLTAEKRIDLFEALRSELKSQEQTISVAEFGRKHLTPDLRNEYAEFMSRSRFPTHAITKDTEYIEAKLKRRQKAIFSSGVQITAPADKFKELVTVKDAEEGRTVVTIQGVIERAE
jgi:hypothetical protein